MKDKSFDNSEKSFDYYRNAAHEEFKLKNKDVIKMTRASFESILIKLATLGVLILGFMLASGVFDFRLGLLFAFLYLIFILWLSVKLAFTKLAKNEDFKILIDSYKKDY